MSNDDWIAGVVLWHEAWWSGLASVGVIFLLQYSAHILLLSPSSTLRIVRRAVVPSAILYFCFDLLLNTRYTLGSKLRDINISCMVWHGFHAALMTAFTFNGSMTGERIPRWCVPEWEREEEERGMRAKDDKKMDQSAPSKPIWWRRTSIPSRPEWARAQRIIPRHWRVLPYPTTIPDRLLWAFDVMLFLRHGTAGMFAEEMRGLEWSKGKLEVAGEAQYKARQAGLSRPPHAQHILPFGYVDAEWPYAVLSTALFVSAMLYMRQVDFVTSSAADFYRLPLKDQLMLTLSIGVSISMMTSLPELILLPLLQHRPFSIPPTALKPSFRSVVQSKSVTELWQFRWHMFAKRGLVRLANMLPPYGEQWQRSMVAQTLKVFFCSGMMHSTIFVRAYPTPTWSSPMTIVGIFIRPYSMLFFLSQGVFLLVEHAWPRVFLMQPDPDSRAAKWVPYARNAWTWSAVLLTAHGLAVEVAAAGMLTHDEVSSLHPISEAKDYYAFFHNHLVGTTSP